MARRKRAEKRKNQRSGFSLILTILALAVVAAILVVGYKAYNTTMRNTAIRNASQQIETFLATLDNIKASLGGYYPSTSGQVDVSSTSPFQEFLGTNKYAYANWKYSCAQGTNSTAQVIVPASFFGSVKEAPDICNAVALTIKKNTAWDASCDSSGNLTITKQNVVCQPAS